MRTWRLSGSSESVLTKNTSIGCLAVEVAQTTATFALADCFAHQSVITAKLAYFSTITSASTVRQTSTFIRVTRLKMIAYLVARKPSFVSLAKTLQVDVPNAILILFSVMVVRTASVLLAKHLMPPKKFVRLPQYARANSMLTKQTHALTAPNIAPRAHT